MKILSILISLTILTFLSACGTGVKVFGSGGLSTTGTDSNDSSNFQFAYATTGVFTGTNTSLGTSSTKTFVSLQGKSSSYSTILSTCNYAGTGCKCTFLNSSGTKIGTSQSIFDNTANTIRCTTTLPNISETYVSNSASTIVSNTVSISSSITASQVVQASSLNANYLNTIYQYNCHQYYLSEADMGATDGLFTCNPTTAPTAGKYFPYMATLTYYLYGNNVTSNFKSQAGDLLYNIGSGGWLCGMQIKQFDCTDSTPSAQFSLYALNSSYFNTPVSLVGGPNQSSSLYGYGAPVVSWSDSSNFTYTGCPPGLNEKVFWQASDTGITSAHSNIPSNLSDTIVDSPSTAPGNLTNYCYVDATSGTCSTGFTCSGNVCTAPYGGAGLTFAGNFTKSDTFYSYGKVTNTTFCAAPKQ